MSERTTIRWGIMATGGIARKFTTDLLIDPRTRQTKDILHQVRAVASSSSVDSASGFILQVIAPKQPNVPCSAHGSYQDLVSDPSVDIIYVATPHSHHYQNVMLCLEAGKPVLCEKPLTVNAEQARMLFKTARQKNLFLMEAVWTRYFPLSVAVRKHITDGDIGEVLRVNADLSVGESPEDHYDPSNRMINKDLAGGCLLDLGIYSLTWIFQTLYHTLPPDDRQPPQVKGVAMTPEPRTGADEMTTILLEFPKSSPTGLTTAHAIATTALRVDDDPDKLSSAGPVVRIQGTLGEIQVTGMTSKPSRYRWIPRRDNTTGENGERHEFKDYEFDVPGNGHGMFYEADEAARCLRDRLLESPSLPWEESMVIMDVMDQVRRQGGLTYPKEIESTEYPTPLKAKGALR